MKPAQIKKIRKQLGLTQTAFARLLSVSYPTVNRWENGRATPQADRIKKLQGLAQPPKIDPLLADLLENTISALYNVPFVGHKYDQQHSDTHMRAVLKIKDFLKRET